MEGLLSYFLIFGTLLIITLLSIFIIVLTQTILIAKRLLLKLEIHVDSFGKDREEIKLKILTFLENFFITLKNLISSGKGGEKNAKKERAKVNKKVVSAALVSAAAVGVGMALSNKKTRNKIAKSVQKATKVGKKELDSIIKKIRDSKIISEDKIKKITKILKDKEGKL